MISAGWKEITSEGVTSCLPFNRTKEAATEGADDQSDNTVSPPPNHLPNEGRLLAHVMTSFSRKEQRHFIYLYPFSQTRAKGPFTLRQILLKLHIFENALE